MVAGPGEDLLGVGCQRRVQLEESAQVAGPVAAQETTEAQVDQFGAVEQALRRQGGEGLGPLVVRAEAGGVLVGELGSDVRDFEEPEDELGEPGLGAQPGQQRVVVRHRLAQALGGEPLRYLAVVVAHQAAFAHPADHVAVGGGEFGAGPDGEAVGDEPAGAVAAGGQPLGEADRQFAVELRVPVRPEQGQQEGAVVGAGGAAAGQRPGDGEQAPGGQPVEGLGRGGGGEDSGELEGGELVVGGGVPAVVAGGELAHELGAELAQRGPQVAQLGGGHGGKAVDHPGRDAGGDERAHLVPADRLARTVGHDALPPPGPAGDRERSARH